MGRAPVRTVLVFAYECAPYNGSKSTVGAQRPAQFAKYLPPAGWRAVVLCCDSRERGTYWPAPAEVGARTREALRRADPDASVIIPLPALPHDGLVDRCWRAVQQDDDLPRRAKAAVRKPLTVLKYLSGDYSQSWQPCAREAAAVVAADARVDVCIGEHSPDAGLFLARWFAARYGVPWVADFRDPMLYCLHPHKRWVAEPFARRVVRTAAHTINATPYWAELDARFFGLPSTSIPNGFDPDEFAAMPNRSPASAFTIAYTGGVQFPHHLRLFLDGLAALRRELGDAAFGRVRFVYRGWASRTVHDLARAAGVEDVSDVQHHVPRDDALHLLGQSHAVVLLSASGADSRDPYLRKGFYPGKTFEYLGARRQILLVPGDGGLLEELVTRTRTGVALRDAKQVSEHLAAAFRAWERDGAIDHRPDEAALEELTRQRAAERLAALLDRVTGRAVETTAVTAPGVRDDRAALRRPRRSARGETR